MENEKEGGAYLMELFYPGGQPYTPPRDLTEEEMEQVLRAIGELQNKNTPVHAAT